MSRARRASATGRAPRPRARGGPGRGRRPAPRRASRGPGAAPPVRPPGAARGTAPAPGAASVPRGAGPRRRGPRGHPRAPRRRPSWRRASSSRSRATARSSSSRRLGLDPRLAGVLGVRRPSPQAERVVERPHRVRGGTAARLHRALEAPGVDGVGAEAEHVAGSGAGDHAVAPAGTRLRLETSAQVAHVRLDRAGGVGGGAVTPDAVGEARRGDDLVPMDHQGCQHGTLAPPAEVDHRTVPGRRQLPEHPQAQPRVLHPLPPLCRSRP